MSAPGGLRETLSRPGVSLVLNVKGRKEPLHGDVVGALDCEDTFEFEVWGVGVRMIELADVRSATSIDLTHAEYRAIKRQQREAHERAASAPSPEEIVELDELSAEERSEEAGRREQEERAPAPRTWLPATPKGGDYD